MAAAAAFVVAACSGSEPAPPTATDAAPVAAGADALGTRTYERNFVFARAEGDSTFLVPWFLETLATPDSVKRMAAGWLARGRIWDPVYSVEWDTPPTRAPARTLPHGDLSFVVREGDVIDGIIFEQGARSLELVLGEATAHWVGPRGEAYELLDGAAYLADQRVEGMVLDMSRASGADAPPGGDWAFLLSGDSAHFVLAADEEHGGDAEPLYRGWAEVEDAQLQWPELRVDWRETQAFPPARRDVPVAWRIWSTDGLLEGELRALSSEIDAGSGPGPLLPVRALFEVAGEVATVEGTFEVQGILVHERR